MGAESFFARYGPINDRAPPSSQSSYDVRIFYPGAALLPEDYMKGLRLHMRVSRSYPSGTAASKDSSALRGLTVEGKAYSSAELSKLVEHFRSNACTLTGASSPVSARLFVPSHHFVEMTFVATKDDGARTKPTDISELCPPSFVHHHVAGSRHTITLLWPSATQFESLKDDIMVNPNVAASRVVPFKKRSSTRARKARKQAQSVSAKATPSKTTPNKPAADKPVSSPPKTDSAEASVASSSSDRSHSPTRTEPAAMPSTPVVVKNVTPLGRSLSTSPSSPYTAPRAAAPPATLASASSSAATESPALLNSVKKILAPISLAFKRKKDVAAAESVEVDPSTPPKPDTKKPKVVRRSRTTKKS
ncbi:hypothetical protein SAMD00019534_079150 [Acytostelium subglobosum LB1]|uniref:hypothetical protein n=1 Tax=Acytostelium subglobosum LB1 TaxID=1410327 RepID=UPI00064515E8|nr:hypothetical protein SAMD00019534_079150 [Acytostelium subglobosum LB1]GAM24740.1 hypothetical protein SAMD00019534_079150 [Acytostelium subglobosum LB1]|eukprot:XP_012752409.1 hypothetical protein SAMD00019534_079150 [Acytostelium subglobosum LB1]